MLAAQKYVFRRSRTTRMFSKLSANLINKAVDELRTIQRSEESIARDELEKHLIAFLTEATATCNPVIWTVLKILIPIVVRLVLDWWLGDE